MTTIYIKDGNGRKVTVEVEEAVAEQMTDCRRAEWRNEAKERYYRDPKMHNLNDHDEEYGSDEQNPETRHIAGEERRDRRAKMLAVLKTLTPKQLEIVKLLKSGMTVSEIARHLNKNQKTVYEAYESIQKKFKEFLKPTP